MGTNQTLLFSQYFLLIEMEVAGDSDVRFGDIGDVFNDGDGDDEPCRAGKDATSSVCPLLL